MLCPVTTCQSMCRGNSLCTGAFQPNPAYTCSCQTGYTNISGICTATTTTTTTTTTPLPPTCSSKSCKICPANPNKCYDCSVLGLSTASCGNIPPTTLELYVSLCIWEFRVTLAQYFELYHKYMLSIQLPYLHHLLSAISQPTRLHLSPMMRLRD